MEGTRDQPANALTEPVVEVRRVGGVAAQAPGTTAMLTPAVEGFAEAPPSAPVEMPPREVGPKQSEGNGP